jgi:thioredoxin-related protein
MKRIVVWALAFAGILVMGSMTTIEPAAEGEVVWITFEQAVEKSKTEKRKIFIDLYTDWCGWCKVMDKKTFAEPNVAKVLNEKYYAVKFNAEQREDVVYNGNTFKFIEQGRSGYHQLAAALMQGKMSYPTGVFLDENFAILSPVPGYREAPEFHKIASFFGDNHYKTNKWEEWNSYKSPYEKNN